MSVNQESPTNQVDDSKDTKFKPGESGNPNGRPVGARDGLRAALRKALKRGGYECAIKKMKDRGVDLEDPSHADLMAEILVWKATEEENLDAIKEIFKQTEKPLPRDINLGGQEDNPIRHSVSEMTDAELDDIIKRR